GICYIEINDYNQAMMTFRKLIKADPEFADAHYYLGNVYLHENLEEKAHEEYKKALDIEPDHLLTHIALAELYFSKKNYLKAKQEFEKARDSESADIEVIQQINLRLSNISQYLK
ncbi:MAG: tetratricopeptide repeat protein, partial [Candidatus Sericytochromatia bacterium]|nr:tetratricopeptide repeat protein [Candidatus Sericytochromatia bacterium]